MRKVLMSVLAGLLLFSMVAVASSESCSDSDGGLNYYENGILNYVNEEGESFTSSDLCVSDYAIVEGFCGPNSMMYDCPFGCRGGVCLKIQPPESTSISISQKIEEIKNETIKQEFKQMTDYTFFCQGCILNDVCYSFGYRKDGTFCSDSNKNFLTQKQPESVCRNDFECTSNICLSEKCVKAGFFQRMTNWFKGLFG